MIAIVSVLGAGYASALMAASSQPKATWAPNPVTISFPAAVGHGSSVVSLTCNPSATGLQLVVTVSGNKLSLTATPSSIASCSSTPTVITLTAKCIVSASQCEGSYDGLVRLTRSSYYGDVPDNLKVNIVVTGPPPDFTFTANPSSLSCTTGSTATSTITIVSQNGFSSDVALTTSALPAGIGSSTSPKTIHGSGITTLTVTCSTAGTFNVAVQGKTPYLSHGITIPVTISNGDSISAADFLNTANPTSITGATDTSYASTITVTGTGSFTGQVALATSSPSQSLQCSLSKDTVTISTAGGLGTSILNCTGATGTYKVTIMATSGSKTHTSTVTYTLGTSSLSASSTANTMFGLDSTLFYAIVSVLAASMAAGGLFLGRKRLSTRN